MLSGFRSGTCVQSGLSSSYKQRASSKAPSLHRRKNLKAHWSLPASSLLWASPTPGRHRLAVSIPASRRSCCHSLLRRGSQFPQRIFPCALSPTTPGSPVAYCSRLTSPLVAGFTLFGGLAVFHSRHEAESSSLPLRLAGSLPEASPSGLLRSTLGQLHVERVIHMVDSFHSTRFASLLAHQRPPRTNRPLGRQHSN